MKCSILCFMFVCLYSLGFSQGIISDIMNVETVSINLSEVNEKQLAKYEEIRLKETTSMEKELAEIDKKYQSEVSEQIDEFTKELKDGDEKIVSVLKDMTITRVNSLTMTHRTDKKNRVQQFLNKMQVANRRLPKFLRQDYADNVERLGISNFERFERDYRAHLATIDAFKNHEHLIVTEGDAATAAN